MSATEMIRNFWFWTSWRFESKFPGFVSFVRSVFVYNVETKAVSLTKLNLTTACVRSKTN